MALDKRGYNLDMNANAVRTMPVIALALMLTACSGNGVRVLPTERIMEKKTASGSFDVSLAPQPDPPGVGDQNIGRMSIDKQFHGELKAHGRGQMLGVRTAVDGSAGYVAMERIVGTLAGNSGSFVLQHSSTMNKGTPTQSISVVPDSGTDQLKGLAGEMTIAITDGKHFYRFEYWFGPGAHE